MNWDTDGDWLVDWFEVNDDEEDGVEVIPLRLGMILEILAKSDLTRLSINNLLRLQA